MVSYGLGFLRWAWKPGIKADLLGLGMPKDLDDLIRIAKAVQRKGFQEMPFVVHAPQMPTVAFEPNFETICEVGVVTIGQILKSYDNMDYKEKTGFEYITSDTIRDTSNWSDTVKIIHLETADWVYDLLDSGTEHKPLMLERIPNVSGRPQYAITPAHENNDDDVALRFIPAVAPIYPVVATMNVTRTLIQSGALNTGRPMYQEVDTTGGKGAQTFVDIMNMPTESRPVLMFDPSEERLRNPKPGKRWDVVPAPDMSWVLKAYENSQRDLEHWGFPVALGPDASTAGSAESGIQQMREMDVSADYLDPVLMNVAKSLHEIYLGVGDTIQGMGLSVTIPVRKKAEGGDRAVRESVTVKPDDFKEQDLEVKLESVSAVARAAIRKSNLELLQLELQSKTTFMRNEYPDWIAEEERIELDLIKTFSREKAIESVKRIIQQIAPAVEAQAAAELGVPLPTPPPLVSQTGGPAPGEEIRRSRPPVPVPGVGSPVDPVDQNPAVSAGTAQQVVG